MLVLTDTATSVIRGLVDRPELTGAPGLRIAGTHNGEEDLTVSTVETPAAGDQVIEDQGARVFLEPGAATLLDDKVLDATVDEQGRVRFLLTVQ
jgi:iron-sulfur cluster assembly protein